MTPEEKQLLLKDLCARLPYGVKVDVDFYHATKELSCDLLQDFITDEKSIRPYLRPMNSMTDEENEIVTNISNKGKGFEEDEDGWIRCDSIHTKWGVWPDGCAKLLDYLNSIHVDYRGLIPMGLKKKKKEDMYK